MIYIVRINDKEYEVEVEKGKATLVNITEAAPAAPAAAPAAVSAPAPAPAAAAVISGGGEVIKAPLPGTILDIKVGAGMPVKKGQILLILEAMKMENEVVAPRDGVVGQIIINKGASVATNDALLTLR